MKIKLIEYNLGLSAWVTSLIFSSGSTLLSFFAEAQEPKEKKDIRCDPAAIELYRGSVHKNNLELEPLEPLEPLELLEPRVHCSLFYFLLLPHERNQQSNISRQPG